jgi:hypothetical protein
VYEDEGTTHEQDIAEAQARVDEAQARENDARSRYYLDGSDDYRKARAARIEAEDALLALCRV